MIDPMYIAMGSIGAGIVLLTLLMRHNLKVLRETKQERLEARRAERRKRYRRYNVSS